MFTDGRGRFQRRAAIADLRCGEKKGGAVHRNECCNDQSKRVRKERGGWEGRRERERKEQQQETESRRGRHCQSRNNAHSGGKTAHTVSGKISAEIIVGLPARRKREANNTTHPTKNRSDAQETKKAQILPLFLAPLADVRNVNLLLARRPRANVDRCSPNACFVYQKVQQQMR